jgi:hypothetical protein
MSLLRLVEALQHRFQRVANLEVFIEVDRFRDVPIRSEVSRFALVLLGCRGTQHDDGRVFTRGTFANAREHVPAGPFRQVQIEEEQDGALRGAPFDFIQETKSLVTIRKDAKMQIHTRPTQREANQFDIGNVVFYDRDPVADRARAVRKISRQPER